MKVKLGEVADQIRGVTYKSQDVEETLSNNSIPLLRANNISNNGIINYDDVIYIKKNKIDSVQLIKQNDILVCASSGSVHLVGKAAQIKEDKLLSFGAFCKVIRPKNIHAIYLGYFFQSPYYRKTISSLAQGANINNIRNDDIDNLMINIYDDVATQEIVSILDKVTSLISKRKKQLEKLDILVKSKFIEMFGDPVLNPKGWEKKKLGEVCDQIRGITYKSQDVEESLNSNSIMLLRANNISNDGTINYDNIIFINKNKVNSIQFIKRNDILVCASSGSVHLVGKAAQIKEYKLLTFGAFCKVVRPKNINPIYIGQFFQSAYYRKTISTLAQGANINNIRNEDIDNITIPIPPLVLQNQFAEFVEQVENNKEKIKSSLNQLETLYSALMQEYFG